MGETASDKLLEGEVGLEGDDAAVPMDILNLNRVGDLQTGGVGDKEILLSDVLLCLGVVVKIGSESESGILGRDHSGETTVDQQTREDGEVNLGEVKGARSRNDKVLEGRPRKRRGDGGQEWRLGGDALQERAVGTVLLALLADDGRDEADDLGLAFLGEDDVGVLQSAEDDGREGLG